MTDIASSPADPTGRAFRPRSADGRVTARIAEVGASLRELRVDGIDLIDPYPDGIPTPSASGVVLAPWPNRVRDGRWRAGDREHRLAITEPALGNASHGLLRFASYREVETGRTDATTLAADIVPQTGYPFHVATRVTYALTPSGIEVEHELTTIGAEAAPVALGTHPFLRLGDEDPAGLTLTLDARERYRTDDRSLPIAREPVDAAHDLRAGRRVGEVDLDTAYADIVRDDEGLIRATLAAPTGATLELWAGEGFSFLQVFTTDRYPGRELAIAIEPMTAPADALNSGTGLRWLEPGETWRLRWGIRLHR